MKLAAASLTDDALFAEVAAIIHEVTGVKPAKITREARLGEDLGVYGEDGHELFEALHDRFEMDWTGLDLGLHVGVEGNSLPWRMRERSDWYESHPLRVGALMEALRAGEWPDYPRIEPPRSVAVGRQVVAWTAFLFITGIFVVALAVMLSRASGS